MAKRANIRRRRRKNITVRYVVLAVVLTAFSVLLGAGVFLKVAGIEVIGNERYSSDMIVEASGARLGSRIFLVNLSKIELNVSKKLSYVDTVDAVTIYPDRLQITVSESYPIAALYVKGDWWILDKNARLLEYGSPSQAEGMIVITGLEPTVGQLGKTIQVFNDQQTVLSRTTTILSAIYAAGLEADISALNVTEPGNITLVYGQNTTVKLGSGANAQEKLMLLAQIADQIDDSSEGTLILGDNGEANYTKH